mmetsp:Transcript_34260/g.74141  ORF Transcript_34260/g.74141 Transcript_34260/m.74141 type:complete len:298 (+) Transcript_34260:318-1211(+)
MDHQAALEAFTPKETVTISVGQYHAQVYVKVTPDMLDFERSFAFHQTVSALKLLPIDPQLLLDTLGNQLNVSMVVDGIKFDWLNYYRKNWYNMAHLTLLSFHNSAGTIMNNATIAGNAHVLKPIQDGLLNDCRPPDVRFVRTKLSLDYRPLMHKDQDNHTLEATFYVELPQSGAQVLDGNGNPRNLVTWHGAADLTTLSVDQVKADILANVPYATPIELNPGAFNVPNAALVDPDKLEVEIEKRVLLLAMTTVEKDVFATLCPNFSSKPHAILEHMKQANCDEDRNIIVQSFQQYYT